MATVTVATYIEAFCVGCGFWSRTHHDYQTCAACGGQTAKKTEFIESGVETDTLTADDEPF